MVLKSSRSTNRTTTPRRCRRRRRSAWATRSPNRARFGEPGQRVVEGLVDELILERLALADVAMVDDDAGDLGLVEEVLGDRLDRPDRAVGVGRPELEAPLGVGRDDDIGQGPGHVTVDPLGRCRHRTGGPRARPASGRGRVRRATLSYRIVPSGSRTANASDEFWTRERKRASRSRRSSVSSRSRRFWLVRSRDVEVNDRRRSASRPVADSPAMRNTALRVASMRDTIGAASS